MEAIRIRNLRSFVDQGDSSNNFVDISPITVFVGKNSCGKSTMLRTFPLLRQSIASNTTGPILWYGDYVDFGSFSQTISNKASNNKIYFDFKTKINSGSRFYYFEDDYRTDIQGISKTKNSDIDITIKLGVIESRSVSRTDRVTVEFENIKIKLIYSKTEISEIQMDGDVIDVSLDNLISFSTRGVLPRLMDHGKNDNLYFYHRYDFLGIYSQLDKSARLLKKCFHNRTDIEKIKSGLARLGVCRRDDFVFRLKRIFNRQKTFINEVDKNYNYLIDVVYPNFVVALIPDILNRANNKISSELDNTKYIAPLRATAERYYRHQDLHVNEIDHTGSNLAIFLSRLNKSQLIEFQTWTSENFGFKVHAGDASLHHEIKIQVLDEDEEYNISDMGFGFSQILPIVASIWNEIAIPSNSRKSNRVTFVIEQPELHLHPQFQNLLAKAFSQVVKITRGTNSQIRILFETHSNVMIDALGEAISDGIINKNDVNIVLFEKNHGVTTTRIAEFNEDGYLTNWPIGFFSGR